MDFKAFKGSLKRSISNPFVESLCNLLLVTVVALLATLGYEYALFCTSVNMTSRAVLEKAGAIKVYTLEGYNIEAYTRICVNSSIYVVDGIMAAMPVSLGELSNVLFVPLSVYVFATVTLVIVYKLYVPKNLKGTSIVYLAIIYAFEVAMVYFTYKLLYVAGSSSTLVSCLQPILIGLLGYKNIAFFNYLVKKV